jgi:hypothetical protein
MKSLRLLAAVSGVLALACAHANAATDSGSFRISLRIAASCEVSTLAAAPGNERVAVSCASQDTPYRLETGARGLESDAREARVGDSEGHPRMTITF